MGICKNAYYKSEEQYYPRLYCNVDNGYCIYSKKCLNLERFIPIDNFEEGECYKYIMNEQKNIPQGTYYVQTSRPNKKGNLYLYVVIKDKVERISTDLKEINQNYVYLKEGLDGFQVSLVPFAEKKQTTNRKSKSTTK